MKDEKMFLKEIENLVMDIKCGIANGTTSKAKDIESLKIDVSFDLIDFKGMDNDEIRIKVIEQAERQYFKLNQLLSKNRDDILMFKNELLLKRKSTVAHVIAMNKAFDMESGMDLFHMDYFERCQTIRIEIYNECTGKHDLLGDFKMGLDLTFSRVKDFVYGKITDYLFEKELKYSNLIEKVLKEERIFDEKNKTYETKRFDLYEVVKTIQRNLKDSWSEGDCEDGDQCMIWLDSVTFENGDIYGIVRVDGYQKQKEDIYYEWDGSTGCGNEHWWGFLYDSYYKDGKNIILRRSSDGRENEKCYEKEIVYFNYNSYGEDLKKELEGIEVELTKLDFQETKIYSPPKFTTSKWLKFKMKEVKNG